MHCQRALQSLNLVPHFCAAPAERWQSLDGGPASADDDGNVLRLHHSMNDISKIKRPTVPNPPQVAFGDMKASRYEQVLKPNENFPPRPLLKPMLVEKIETSLLHEPPANKV